MASTATSDVIFEEDTSHGVKLDKADKGGIVDFEPHEFKDLSLSFLVFLLAERLLGVSLVSIQVGHVLVELLSLAC